MTHFKYHKISKNRKLRLICNTYKDAPFIVFLHGFMSDLEGKKPNAFLKFAKKNKLSFLALEYSGHGKSSGKFINGNITKWSNETSVIIKKFVKKKDFTIVGSSMGAWLALKQFQKFKGQIKGFLGIGSAPEFLENLMWKKFLKELISEHFNETGSNLSQKIIKNYDEELRNFIQVCPKEMLDKLSNPISFKPVIKEVS